MPTTQYDVQANLRLRGVGGASQGVAQLAGHLQHIGNSIRGIRSPMSGLVTQVAALGASYIGIRAVGSAFSGFVRGAVAFNAELSRTQIGLQSVISAVDEIPFEEAGQMASSVFRQLQDDAIRSTATTQELFGIFQGIVGPIRSAGFALEDVRDITNSTVAAASALNVDFAQAQRDINAIVRGAAGIDVKLFSMLQSTGRIAETTEEWNRSLTSQERINRLSAALGSFSDAAEAYGRSWAGVTSSLADIIPLFRQAFASPIIDAIRRQLASVVDGLVSNREQIVLYLSATGQVVAQSLERVFERIRRGFLLIIQNWDAISSRLMRVANVMRQLAPPAAMVALGVQLARTLIGGGFQAAGAAAALGAGGGAAGAGGAVAPLAAAISAAAPGLALIAAIFAGLASVGVVVARNWGIMVAIFDEILPILQALWGQFGRLMVAAWELLSPILELIGALALVAVWEAFTKAVQIAQVAIGVLTEAFIIMRGYISSFVDWIKSAVPSILGGILGDAMQMRKDLNVERRETEESGPSFAERIRAAIERVREGGALSPERTFSADQPNRRTRVVNDFRGSRIEVKQDFRQADPDRVAVQMIEDINRQAEARIQSGLAPAFSR